MNPPADTKKRSAVRAYIRSECVVFCKTKEAFGGLSNMASGFPIEVNAVRIRTSEALYQACRFPHIPELQRAIIAQGSPMTAKMKGKPFQGESRPDWERARVKIMRWCLRVKLAQNWLKFGKLLLSTEDRPIVEQSRKDAFWGAKIAGDGTLVGVNALGRLLMELRHELKTLHKEQLLHLEPLDISDFLLYGAPIRAVEARNIEFAEDLRVTLKDTDEGSIHRQEWDIEESATDSNQAASDEPPSIPVEEKPAEQHCLSQPAALSLPSSEVYPAETRLPAEAPALAEIKSTISDSLTFYGLFLHRVEKLTTEKPLAMDQLLGKLDIQKPQLHDWLKRAVDEQRIKRLNKPTRYLWVSTQTQQPSLFNQLASITAYTIEHKEPHMLKFIHSTTNHDVYLARLVDGKEQRTLLEPPLGFIAKKTTKVAYGPHGPDSFQTAEGDGNIIDPRQRGAAMAIHILREYAAEVYE